MTIEFYKYQGTGNDFIVIDNRNNQFDMTDHAMIAALCERRMGIGADGLILLHDHDQYDFEMIYFNSDGFQSTMCGNGGRCIISFANSLSIIDNETIFMAIDGVHKGKVMEGEIALQMQDVNQIEKVDKALILNTGSPHYVKFVDNLSNIDVEKEGREIRNTSVFKRKGINVNFVENNKDIYVRTYERGVEDETLSCGTGVVASAIAMYHTHFIEDNLVSIQTRGGELTVSFDEFNGTYQNVWLIGQVSAVYAGEFSC